MNEPNVGFGGAAEGVVAREGTEFVVARKAASLLCERGFVEEAGEADGCCFMKLLSLFPPPVLTVGFDGAGAGLSGFGLLLP